MINTVKGRIDAGSVGVTMCHEHLALDLSPVRKDTDSVFDDSVLIESEVDLMKALGVKSVIEVTCNDMGRNVRMLKQISRECGIHIIASTGFYLEAYHPESVRSGTIGEICDIFCRDILEGIDGTDIRAGIIGEVAGGEKELAPSEEKVLKAAAAAGVKTGCAVTTHCQLGQLGLEQSGLLQGQGIDPDKVILGHIDLSDDRAYQKAILDTGVNIAYDTVGKTAYLSDEKRADNLMWLLEKGYEDHILLSQDISRRSYMVRYGKYDGYTTVMKRFVPLLREKGVSQETLDKMLIHNPARILDM